jgi:hypothetical protein
MSRRSSWSGRSDNRGEGIFMKNLVAASALLSASLIADNAAGLDFSWKPLSEINTYTCSKIGAGMGREKRLLCST